MHQHRVYRASQLEQKVGQEKVWVSARGLHAEAELLRLFELALFFGDDGSHTTRHFNTWMCLFVNCRSVCLLRAAQSAATSRAETRAEIARQFSHVLQSGVQE